MPTQIPQPPPAAARLYPTAPDSCRVSCPMSTIRTDRDQRPHQNNGLSRFPSPYYTDSKCGDVSPSKVPTAPWPTIWRQKKEKFGKTEGVKIRTGRQKRTGATAILAPGVA